MSARRIGAVVALVGASLAIVAGFGASASSASTTTRAATQSKAFVVLVTDINQLNDHGFNQLAYQGLLRAEAKLGISGARLPVAVRRVYIPNLAQAARKGADLVISVGFDQAVAVANVAKQFPKTHFAIIDVDQTTLAGKPKNVEGLIFKEQEVGYLAGYLAGLLEKQKGGHATIGSVGGQKQPPVDRYIAGYQAGAKKADPASSSLNSTRRTGSTRRSASRLRSTRSRRARTSSSRSPAAAASACSTRPRRRGSGASASTPTSRTSARRC